MSVHLFVWSAGGSPKCCGSYAAVRCVHVSSAGVRRECGSCRGTGYLIPSAVDRFDGWALVECDNPEDGRLLLAQLSIGESCRTVAGRIIVRVLGEDK